MKAVILAAGIAFRLRPLTDNIPKCLLKLGGKSILERTIDNLINNSIEELIIVTGYLEEKIKSFINQSYPSLKVTYIFNDVYDSTNNIYSLWLVKDYIKATNILLMDSDIIFDRRIVELLLISGPGNYLAVRSDHVLGEEEMKVIAKEDNQVTKIGKRIDPQLAVGESIGIEKFEAGFLEVLFEKLYHRVVTEGRVNDFYEAAFQDAIDDGQGEIKNCYEELLGSYAPDRFSGFKRLNIENIFNTILFYCIGEGVLKTKLNKLLFYADFLHFKEYSASITGARYVHLTYGPILDNYEFYLATMIHEDSSLIIEEKEFGSYLGEILVSKVSPDLRGFKSSEMKVLAYIKEYFDGYTASDISLKSHQEKGYKETDDLDFISYEYADSLEL